MPILLLPRLNLYFKAIFNLFHYNNSIQSNLGKSIYSKVNFKIIYWKSKMKFKGNILSVFMILICVFQRGSSVSCSATILDYIKYLRTSDPGYSRYVTFQMSSMKAPARYVGFSSGSVSVLTQKTLVRFVIKLGVLTRKRRSHSVQWQDVVPGTTSRRDILHWISKILLSEGRHIPDVAIPEQFDG